MALIFCAQKWWISLSGAESALNLQYMVYFMPQLIDTGKRYTDKLYVLNDKGVTAAKLHWQYAAVNVTCRSQIKHKIVM